MKTLTLLSVAVFAMAMLSMPARADEPQAVKLTPQIQAMLAQLLKTADGEAAPESAPAEQPTTAPSAPATPPAPPQLSKKQPSSLATSGLQTSSLMPSASLGGRGMTGGAPRLTKEEWRELFPVRR